MQTAFRADDGFQNENDRRLADQLTARTTVSDRPAVLLFDMCGVLFDDTIWTRWLFQLVSRVGPRMSFEQFVRGWDEQFVVHVNSGRRDYWDAVHCYLLSFGLARGTVDEICVAAKARRRQFDDSIRPLPGTKAGLCLLSSCGYRMAVIGNGPHPADLVRQRLCHLGLHDLFHDVFASLDVCRVVTPNMRYCYVSEQLGVNPQTIWFISSSALELQAARDEGLEAIAWQAARHVAARRSIEHLHDLARLVGSGHSLAG